MKKALFIIIVLAMLSGCGQSEAVRVVFTPGPGQDLSTMQERYGDIIQYLEDETGYDFEIVIAASYAAAIEDLRGGHSSIMRGAPAAYVRVHDQIGVEFLARESRKVDGDTYMGMIIAKPGLFSEPYNLADVAGHTMAFVDPGSMSGYIFAKVLLNQAGVEISDLGETAYMGSHPAVIEMIVSGAVDVGATCDKWVNVAIEEGVATEGENYVVLAYSPRIPRSAWFIRANLPAEMKDAIRQALLEIPPEVAEPASIYSFVEATDSDYDFVREIIKASEE